MDMKKYLSYICLVTLLTVTFGCANFGNTDVNPNGANVPLTSTLLTNVLTVMGASQTGSGESSNYLYASYYCQYESQALYTDASRYALVDLGWNLYAGRVEDLQNIIDVNTNKATADYAARTGGSNNNQIAIARILKAYWMSVITDRFGDVPYSQAFKGIPNPVFDSQQSIYLDLLNELKAAVAQFDSGPPVVGDIVFGGDNSKWMKFANSWRLVLALRISKADATTGKTHAADVISNLGSNGGVFTTSADDMTLVYPGSGAGFQNPWLSMGSDQVVCKTIADWLNTNNDSRRFAFGNASGNTLIGMPPGLARADALNYTSANPNESLVLNNSYRQDVSPLVVLSSGDVWLARAEAASLGWTSENVSTCYNNGITQSWNRWGQTNATALANYLAAPAIALGSGSGPSDAEKIGIQRWVSFYPNGDQGWSEWRRTGYPSFVTAVPNSLSTSGQIPVRYIYPTAEHGLNPVNWAAASALLDNGDSRDSHVWWDK
jgi:hypothetical protein